MRAGAGEKIYCKICGKKVGLFNRDCSDYDAINKTEFDRINGEPIVTVEPFHYDATRYGCEPCGFDALTFHANYYTIEGLVRK